MIKKNSSNIIKKLKKIFLTEDTYKTLEEQLNMGGKVKNYKMLYNEIDTVLSKSTENNIEQSLVKVNELLKLKIDSLKSIEKKQLETIKSMEYFKKKHFKKINKQDKEVFLKKYEDNKKYYDEINQLLTNSLDQRESYMQLADNFLVLGYISSENLQGKDITGLDPKKNNVKINLKDIYGI